MKKFKRSKTNKKGLGISWHNFNKIISNPYNIGEKTRTIKMESKGLGLTEDGLQQKQAVLHQMIDEIQDTKLARLRSAERRFK